MFCKNTIKSQNTQIKRCFFFPESMFFPILYEDFRQIIFTAQYFFSNFATFLKTFFQFRTKSALTVECATYKNKKV